MSVTAFGEIDGKPVQEIRLKSASGAEASVISFGATLRDLQVPLKSGGSRRVVLGFEASGQGIANLGASRAALSLAIKMARDGKEKARTAA